MAEAGDGAEHSPLGPLESPTDDWLALVRRAESPRSGGRIGGYEVLAEIGRGGQGLVLRARHEATGRIVALKRLAAGCFSSPVARRRFEREIEVAASLAHPGIVTVHGVEEVDGAPLLAMEWVEGRTLTEWTAAQPRGSAGLRRKLELFLQVCDAVQHAHGRGVIHRDLKPSNILVDGSGRCRLLDFGLARRIEREDDATRTLGFIGTPAYAPPEHFQEGDAPLDARSDVYSLGVVLFECLTGVRPFRAPRLRELIREIEEREAPRPSSLARDLDAELDAVVLKACAKAPDARYPTVHALHEDLQRYLAGRPVQAVPPRALYLARKWIRRNRLTFGFSVALAVAVVAAAAIGFRQAAVIAVERDRARDAAKRAGAMAERALTLQKFYLEAIRSSVSPIEGASRSVEDVLDHLASHARERLGEHLDLAVETLMHVGQHYMWLNEFDRARPVVEDALELIDELPTPDPSNRAVLLGLLGTIECWQGARKEGRALLEESAQLYAALPDPNPSDRASLLIQLGEAQFRDGDLAEAERTLAEARSLARAADAYGHFVWASELGTKLLLRLRRSDEAGAVAREALALAEEHEAPGSMPVAMARVTMALYLWTTADAAGAVPYQERAVAALRELLEPSAQILVEELLNLGAYLSSTGRHADALAVFEEVSRVARLQAPLALAQRGLAVSHGKLGHAAEAADHARAAVEAVSRALGPADFWRVRTFFDALHLLIAAELFEEAEALYPRLAAEVRASARLGLPAADYLVKRAAEDVKALGYEVELEALVTEMLELVGDRVPAAERAAIAAASMREE